ncbi:DUF2079 domain-containing protein [Neosynechococcus sphagnicola]|uniref:DUF2079 domain-containing protein n=1 Tax=Neosynechococcus sphagnicola TaxID=1501145 RepID=UPI000A476E81|nr:DUF2079 domain-containing protein [Neosynechococcus sphagnicola]
MGGFFKVLFPQRSRPMWCRRGEYPDVSYHRLGQHFTPALLLWLPIYALFPSPVTLTVIQVTLITAAGIVLYALARHYLQPPLASLITVSFYGANAVVGPTLANFHDSCQTPLFVFSLLLALEKRRWGWFTLMAVLIPLVREDAGIILFSIGFYLVVSRRYPRIGLLLCILSFAYMMVLTNLIMPLFSADISRRFMLERFGQYATGEEASTLDILRGMLSQPWRLVVELVTPFDRTARYLLGQWLPLAFVPAIAPASWLVAGFPLLKLLLGRGDSVLAINIRYALTVVPGLFYGAILWWSQHPRFWTPWFRRFWIGCIGLSLAFTLTSNPNRTLYFLVPDALDPWVYVSLPRQWQHVEQLRPLLSQIPPQASVAATTYLVPHLSSRREILRFPDLLQLRNDVGAVVSVDYIVADLWQMQQYEAAFKGDRQTLKSSIERIDQLTQTHAYGIIGCRDGVILLQRGVPSNPEALAAWLAFRQTVAPLLQKPI